MENTFNFVGNCRTTAMGIMPHTNIGKALELSLGLDIPFWPQLPNVSYYEDMHVQASELKEKNENAFVWLDEPGLGWVFSGLSGYDDVVAKREYGEFLESLSGPNALHLCADVNLPYLLSTDSASLAGETPESLAGRLLYHWSVVSANTDITMEEMAQQAFVAPARCCLKNIGTVGALGEPASKRAACDSVQPEEYLVETAFAYLKEISQALRARFDISE